MPILKGAATFSRYRVEKAGKSPLPNKKNLPEALRLRAFQPLDPTGPDERVCGFVEFLAADQVDFTPGATYEGEYALFAYRIDEVRLPSAVVRAEFDGWKKRFEAEHQRPPGKKEKSDAKEEVRHTLKSRYPLTTKTYDVSWNLTTDLLQIWAGSRKAVDEVQGALEQAFTVSLVPVVPASVATALQLAIETLSPTPALSMPDQEAAHAKE
jgi:DNA recombination-dependent growth factor C